MPSLKRLCNTLLLTFWCALSIQSASANEFDHSRWNTLLQNNVVLIKQGQASQVNYQGMLNHRAQLQAYLAKLSAVTMTEYKAWAKAEQLSFLINAYNAFTVDLILTKYPKLKSIKELGSFFRSPWKKRFIPLLDKTRSLDNIEQVMIRKTGHFNEPRIHFAVNCASISCPALRNEAFTAEKLESQLEAATKGFLADRSRNRYHPQTNKLEVSKIFNWYQTDFERGWHNWHSLNDFFTHYADSLVDNPSNKKALESGKVDINFLNYNWRLNSKH